jgi:hypothetical protein
MTFGYSIVLLAVDHLQTAVAQELSVRYCPHDKAIFLVRCLALLAVFTAAALTLFLTAYRRSSGRTPRYIIAGGLLLFAIGTGALVLYGLSGCSGVAAEGLIWDWP